MEAPIKKDKSPLEDSQWLSDLYRGLRSLEDHSFPKKCPKCGNVFISLTDFLCLTDKTMHSTGLLQSNDDRNSPIVGLFRNCTCGSVLFIFCKDRRDTSDEGQRRRETFGHLFKKLKDAGVDADLARQELLKVVRGEESDLLRELTNPDATAESKARVRSLLTKR